MTNSLKTQQRLAFPPYAIGLVAGVLLFGAFSLMAYAEGFHLLQRWRILICLGSIAAGVGGIVTLLVQKKQKTRNFKLLSFPTTRPVGR